MQVLIINNEYFKKGNKCEFWIHSRHGYTIISLKISLIIKIERNEYCGLVNSKIVEASGKLRCARILVKVICHNCLKLIKDPKLRIRI